MIYDCFLYNGERKLLKARIKELKNVVDIFVLVEGALTFTGLKRKKSDLSWVKLSGNRFRRIWRTEKQMEARDPWEREEKSRNALIGGLYDAVWSDTILFSDVDEIPYKEMIKTKCPGIDAWQIIEFHMYWAYFNTTTFVNQVWAPGMKAIKMENFRDWYGCEFNDLRSRNAMETIKVKDSGIHLSFCEDPLYKIKSYSHTETNTPDVNERIKRSLENGHVFWDEKIKTGIDESIKIPGGFHG